MILFIKLAWRNIFRNKRRTVIAGSAIGLGLAALIFTDALILGTEQGMIKSATSTFLGEAQIHASGFRQDQDTAKVIRNLPEVTASLAHDPLVTRFAIRTLSLGMITSPADVSAIELAGVVPEQEKYLSSFQNVMVQGNYFEGGDDRDIIIGAKLAKTLDVGVGDRVVVTMAQAHSSELAQEMFRVSGIFRFGIDELDKGMALVRIAKARQLLGIGDNAHEIALRFTRLSYAQDPKLPFWKNYSTDGNEALGWPGLMPEMKSALSLSWFSIYIIGVLLFGIIAFGIVNTLFMSLYERMFEFGVMRAIGTRPVNMAELVLFEAGALAAVSIVLGMLLGLASALVFMKVGLNYTGVEFAGVTFREPLHTVPQLRQFIIYPIAVFFLTVIAGIYPAVYAARMSAIEAMRRSM